MKTKDLIFKLQTMNPEDNVKVEVEGFSTEAEEAKIAGVYPPDPEEKDGSVTIMCDWVENKEQWVEIKPAELSDNENNAIQITTLITSYLKELAERADAEKKELTEKDFLNECREAIKRQLYSLI